MTDADEVSVALTPHVQGLHGEPLLTVVQRSDRFRGSLAPRRTDAAKGTLGGGELVLAGLFAPATLVGLFQLVRSWMDLQRGQVTVDVSVDGVHVAATLEGRFDPADVTERVIAAARQVQEAQPPTPVDPSV
jgi:hypothetical protein